LGAQIITKTSQKPPACGGIFCGRQEILAKVSSCGCFFSHKSEKSETVVLQTKIKIDDLSSTIDF